MSFLTATELAKAGFASLGENVLISAKASIYGAERISIGSNVRIDDFCVLSAGEEGISIGSFIHIAAFSSLIGAARITIRDFANLSSRVSIYSSSDDYSGASMTNPMVPNELKNVDHRPVTVGRHAIIGSGSVVLPSVELGEGVAIGALSLVRASCDPFTIHAGTPAKQVGERSRELLKLEGELSAHRDKS